MAAPTDPTFGAGFDAALFRAAITSTMEMGLPNATSERATFRWLPERTWTRQDRAGQPYNWSSSPATEVTHADVQIPVAVESAQNARNTTETIIGAFDTPRVTVTVLDTHYPQVADANQIIFDDNVYNIEYWGPPIGLFTVTIYTCYAVAMDES